MTKMTENKEPAIWHLEYPSTSGIVTFNLMAITGLNNRKVANGVDKHAKLIAGGCGDRAASIYINDMIDVVYGDLPEKAERLKNSHTYTDQENERTQLLYNSSVSLLYIMLHSDWITNPNVRDSVPIEEVKTINDTFTSMIKRDDAPDLLHDKMKACQKVMSELMSEAKAPSREHMTEQGKKIPTTNCGL